VVSSLTKIAAATAAEVCQRFAPGDAARALLADGLAPGPYLDRLQEQRLFPDGVAFLAHALPKREAVWWACRCVRTAAPPATPPAAAALEAAERWVANPDEDNRRKAQAAAEAAPVSTPSGCAAMAAFLSGGSLAPPDVQTPVPPGEHLTARLVAGAVQLAAVVMTPEKAPEKFSAFLALGREVAAGADQWPRGAG
jgi:hypothetical protein